MAFAHGKDAHFAVQDAGGTLRDLSLFCDSVEGPPGERDTPETTTFKAPGMSTTFIGGLITSTVDITGGYDSVITTGPDVVLFGIMTTSPSRTFEVGYAGNATGAIRYTGACLCTSYTPSAPVNGWVTFAAKFQITGAVTRNTFP